MSLLPHDYNRYTHGCRCEACRNAKAEYMRARRADARKEAQRPGSIPGRYLAPIEKHGTRYGYEEAGCRCFDCTAARTRSDAAYVANVKGTLTADDPRHGTRNGYTRYACRCLPCTEAAAAYYALLKRQSEVAS